MTPYPKILYIDDESENLVGFKISFEKLYSIYTADNTSVGYDLLKTHEFSIVMVDYKMPVEDGVSFIERIKNEFSLVVFIVITGYADLEVVIKAINMNCFNSFVQKPWNYNELKITLNNAVELYESKKENKLLLEDLLIKNKQLEESNVREKNLNNLKDVFLKNISHEIRTPLNSIIGFANVAYDESGNNAQKSHLKICINSSYQLLKVVENIFAASLMMTNQYTITKEEFNLRNLIDDLMFIRELKGHNHSSIEFRNDVFGDVIINNDKDKIQLVIDSLIDNAQKFTPKGYVHISAYTDDGENIVVAVKDTGIGISKDKQPYIFEAFRQGDESNIKQYGGNGLGLYLAKSFAELLEGKVWFESEPNSGSTFCFSVKKNL